MTGKQVEIMMLEPHKAEGIKELCYKEINNPDKNYTFLGAPNITIGERRADLLRMRQQAGKAMTALEKESEELLNSETVSSISNPAYNKAVILAKLNDIMDVVSIIDKYSIEHTKTICKKSTSEMAQAIGHAVVNFPLTFEGEEVVVNCYYYEDISLNEDLMKEYLALDDEEKEIEFIKKHVELGNVTLTTKSDVEILENMVKNNVIDKNVRPNPVFANLDPIYIVDTEVDK